jgi:hypothetical protein
MRWLRDDPAVATLMGLERVRSEDAFEGLPPEVLCHCCNGRKPNFTPRCSNASLPTGIPRLTPAIGHEQDALATWAADKFWTAGTTSHLGC